MTAKRYHAGKAEDVKAQKLKDRVEQTLRLRRWSNILNTPDGMAVIRELLVECHMYSSAFTGNSATYYNEGRRDIGLIMMKVITDVFHAGGISKDRLTAFLITQLDLGPDDINLKDVPAENFSKLFKEDEDHGRTA